MLHSFDIAQRNSLCNQFL